MSAYVQNVFVNCPFDEAYRTNMFRAIVFAVYDCGFSVRCALEENNSADPRINKIVRIIRQCKYGVHDLSRTELDATTGLPRFNMPLELGMFLGAKRFGNTRQREKPALVLDVDRYRYGMFISDIAGQDISSHDGESRKAIVRIRDWLAPHAPGTIPGGKKMADRFEEFHAQLPTLCAGGDLDDDPPYNDYVYLVCQWLS